MLPRRVPVFDGPGIRVTFREDLRTAGRRLYSGPRARRMRGGQEVHAATFIRQRRIVLDRALLRRRGELGRILVHELFHFVWVRLSNAQRDGYGAALADELEARARGELGWSAQMRKGMLASRAGRAWREYVCESFCDTAAWLYSGVKRHQEFTLAPRFRERRAAWFEAAFAGRAIRL
ncbi:MAG: hypothetical protein ABSF98_21795 [Bryobacteraceae bacterium]